MLGEAVESETPAGAARPANVPYSKRGQSLYLMDLRMDFADTVILVPPKLGLDGDLSQPRKASSKRGLH